MKIIKDIINHMDETMSEAEDYVYEARLIKDEYPQLFSTYLKLADEHLAHYNLLHTSVVQVINDYRRMKGDPPKEMEAIYKYEHEKLTEKYEDIKRAIDRAKMM